MGRILEILRQDSAAGRSTEPPHTFSTDWAPAADKAVDTPNNDADIPFIEVGPHHWLEASPGVLAAGNVAKRNAAPTRVTPAAPAVSLTVTGERAEAQKPAPRKVTLRELPAKAQTADFAPELVAFHAPRHPVSMQYRELIQTMLHANEGQALLFTAARGEAGATTAILNLAISAAQLGRSVVVVDANWSRPAVGSRLGIPESPGLRELLSGKVDLERALRKTPLSQLQAIAAGLSPVGTVTRLPSERMHALLTRLRERYDVIFIDAPSWDGRPELVALGQSCDAVYLVLPEAEAESREAQSLCQLIPEQGAKLAGCVLSRY